MKSLFPLFACAISLFMIGCASGRPVYHNEERPGCAVVKGKAANIIKVFSEGEAHVTILEVDGQIVRQNPFTAGPGNTVYLSPGKHIITASAENAYVVTQGPLPVNVKSGGIYRVRAYKIGVMFDVQFWDETRKPFKLLETLRVGATATQPVPIPIMIPMG